MRLAILLHLDTLLHHARREETAVIEHVAARDNNLTIQFAPYELINHPLQKASLEQEARYLKKAGVILTFSS